VALSPPFLYSIIEKKMIELENVKDILWISNDNDDVRLEIILDWINEIIIWYLWDIEVWTKTIQVSKNIKKIWLLHKNCTSLTSINWINIEAGTYQITDNDEIEVTNLYTFLSSDFEKITVVYEAWYSDFPKDIVLAGANLVWFEFAKDLWQIVASEKMWPRAVSYFVSDVENAKKDFYKTLSKYIPNHLKIW